MSATFSCVRFGDGELRRELVARNSRECAELATILALIAEFDARKLFRPDGYPSMHAWCVGVLRYSDDAAYRRITAARTARRFPAIFEAVAAGRLHLTAVLTLAPCLSGGISSELAGELIAAATHKGRFEIERLLAGRFPRPDVPTRLVALPAPLPGTDVTASVAGSGASLHEQLAPARVLSSDAKLRDAAGAPHEPSPAADPSNPPMSAAIPAPHAAPVAYPAPAVTRAPARVTPLAPQRFALQVTIDQETHELLRQAQALLAHSLPSRDVAQVMNRALTLLVRTLEKRKFGATERARRSRAGGRRARAGSRHIPASVRRAVHERDGGRCTYVSENGHRCEARERLEFDHVHEHARGGESTAANLRLRCRAHNQYAAERTYGAGFMDMKRRKLGAVGQRE